MAMIGPLPVSPAAPTPWSFDSRNHAVRDALGRYLFEINGEKLDPDEDAALARELVDLVNRAAAGPEPVTEPDPRDPSTWRRYVDEVGDVWFEFAPGRVGCGSRGALGRFVSDMLSRGRAPKTLGEALDDAREWFGLRRA